ncbi:MAG TPA: hypothetical protein VM427_01670 [Patescibacteria group bacterium]|nr:hypothetical protein [Patescibacteria group bacterium]
MTDPIEELQPPATGANPPRVGDAAARDSAARDAAADNHPAAEAQAGDGQAGNPPAAVARPTGSSLRVDPDRPKDTGWREPAWFPPREKARRPSVAILVAGLAMVAVGLLFLLTRILGPGMLRIEWSTVWPVLLIALGAILLIRSVRRRS